MVNAKKVGEVFKCDICGNTFKSYTNSKHKNVCKECFSKINED